MDQLEKHKAAAAPFHPLHQTLLYLAAEMPSVQKEETFDTSEKEIQNKQRANICYSDFFYMRYIFA